MTKRQFILMLLLNLLIASSFFIKNIGVGYSQLSSDMQNIVPMCMKLDDNSLFPNDLYLTTSQNFEFYTPFFVEMLRFFGGITQGNYVQATNLLLFISSIGFGVLWFFLLFKILKQKFWITLLLSILMRGIVWLPMWEFWGISDLWTIMPRTFYIVLLPIPFLLLYRKSTFSFFSAAFLIGLIFNFHPISGLGGILIFIAFLGSMCYFKYAKCNLKQMFFGFLMIMLGMLPFILTYFGKTDSLVSYDLTAYNTAFNSKIPSRFQRVDLILQSWLKLKFLFFLLPFVIFVLYAFLISKKYRQQALILTVITLSLFFLPLLSIYLELLLNRLLHINLRMSFQIVRIQKLVILPGYIAMGFLLLIFFEKYVNLYRYLPFIFCSYMIILLFSNPNSFNNIIFFGDDISRSILPRISDVVKPISQRKTDFDKMADYIAQNTPVSSTFYNTFSLRCAAKRSVRFDSKGANILVEGNPQKLIEWYTDTEFIKRATLDEKLLFLKQAGVDYILAENKDYPLHIKKQIGNQRLYLIK